MATANPPMGLKPPEEMPGQRQPCSAVFYQQLGSDS
ncbi:unnamed protein product, partial [Allacma fusca]